jgi:signal transduction histidine kinase
LQDVARDLTRLADYLAERQAALIQTWRLAIRRDPKLTNGDSLPRAELIDHIPSLLAIFERTLRHPEVRADALLAASDPSPAAAHGLQRWQQGYDLHEVTRELGKLNECVILELDRYAKATPEFSLDGLIEAHRVWTQLCSTAIEESVSQYFALQQQESAGHVADLETALDQIREMEQQRGAVWQQAAHDLRGNLGVVANATVGLTRQSQNDSLRDNFVRILMRNVTSLHHLLDDVTSLARLQAGQESRQIEPLDLTAIIEPLCDGIRPIATQRGLYLNATGPDGFAAEGDAVKIRRIAQNLILNAVKYTRAGGVTVTWGNSSSDDEKRWLLEIADTGPGIHTPSGQPIASALDPSHEPTVLDAQPQRAAHAAEDAEQRGDDGVLRRGEAGEGIGLSIVKRLCEMLDATIEIQSQPDTGTTFRILFPRAYLS